MPEIIQVLFKSNDPNLLDKNLERKIYETRKRIENKAFDASLNNFYICSISSKSIIYKGLYLAEAISDFYLDLKDTRFISRYAIFHQRFSTNTAPSWDLAQPFRAVAHNGEINTLRGNINWMKVHEQEMYSPIFKNMENLIPVIPSGNSDSASLDNVPYLPFYRVLEVAESTVGGAFLHGGELWGAFCSLLSSAMPREKKKRRKKLDRYRGSNRTWHGHKKQRNKQ